MDTQAKQHLLSTLCELGFCFGLDKSLFMIFPNFANFWLGHHNVTPIAACPHLRPTSSCLEPKYCFSHSKVKYTDFSLNLYTVTQTEESKSRRKAQHEDLLNVRNVPFKLTSVFFMQYDIVWSLKVLFFCHFRMKQMPLHGCGLE